MSECLGILMVDHGSRRPRSNEAFLEIAEKFAARSPQYLVEAAHMELAEPTIGQAFDKLVERGATSIIIHPYFLLPGRHSREDIPQLSAEAARRHPDIKWAVTDPLGLSEHILDVVEERISVTEPVLVPPKAKNEASAQ